MLYTAPMRVDLFDFDLPPERIALEPASPRDAAQLLHVAADGLHDRIVRDLPTLLRTGDMLIANDTKVIPAQLFGTRAARGEGDLVAIEATLHKDMGEGRWRAFVRPAKRLREGDVIAFGDELSATVKERDGAEAVLAFDTGAQSFKDALDQAGVMPLPPYIARRRPAGDEDKAHYQAARAKEHP